MRAIQICGKRQPKILQGERQGIGCQVFDQVIDNDRAVGDPHAGDREGNATGDASLPDDEIGDFGGGQRCGRCGGC